jgi:hypothetical protein
MRRYVALILAVMLSAAGCDGNNSTLPGGDSSPLPSDGGPEPDASGCPEDRVVCEGVCCEEGARCRQGSCCADENVCGSDCCGEGELCLGGICHLDCDQGTRCLDADGNEMCCGANEICFMSSCRQPGNPCTSDTACELDEYCETSAGVCLPIPASTCEYRPPQGQFSPTVEWSWPPKGGPSAAPNHVDVLTPPAVGDMDGDGVPEIAIVAYRDKCDGGSYNTGMLTILRGDTGKEVLRLNDPNRRLYASTMPALGDLDADNLPEVVVMQTDRHLLAYELDGTLL